MPVSKLLASGTSNAMKVEEGNDSLDFIRHAVGKEPALLFSRPGDNPLQLFQFLQALDQQDLPGWPLLTHLKVPMQKCEKCAGEFCSSINYRRHIRVHRRTLNVAKESHKNRDLLGGFWDKLTLDDAKEVMSFTDVVLGEVPGSLIVSAIASNLESGFYALPQAYVKAGSMLVDIIQGRPRKYPISSQEFFNILDDASERTFLCAGTAESLQKYVFDGDAGKIGLEMKNLIACASFLVEQRLVKAWLAEKDAEALRCQKLLVEEEEAAQKRQAELLERKRQRKLRQKEQKAKDRLNGEKADLNCPTDLFDSPLSTETSRPALESVITDAEFSNDVKYIDIEAQGGCLSEHSDSGTWEHSDVGTSTSQNVQENSYKQFLAPRWQVLKLQKGGRNGIRASHNKIHMLKRESVHKYGPHRDQRAGSNNGSKVWAKKTKPDSSAEFVRSRVQNDATNQTDPANCQVMIGSISVTVRRSMAQHQVSQVEAQDSNNREVKENGVQASDNNHSTETRAELANRSSNQVSEDDASQKSANRTMPSESCLQSCERKGNDSNETNDFHQVVDVGVQRQVLPFSSDAAKEFLAQRWKEALAEDHVTLVISSELESLDTTTNDELLATDSKGRSILGSTEDRLADAVGVPNGNGGKGKSRKPPEKGGVKIIKYIPKQKCV